MSKFKMRLVLLLSSLSALALCTPGLADDRQEGRRDGRDFQRDQRDARPDQRPDLRPAPHPDPRPEPRPEPRPDLRDPHKDQRPPQPPREMRPNERDARLEGFERQRERQDRDDRERRFYNDSRRDPRFDHHDSGGWRYERDRPDWWRGHPDFRDYNGPRQGWYYAPHYGYYRPPMEWYGHRWYRGEILPRFYWSYRVFDFFIFGLPPLPYGCVYVHAGPDILMIDERTGRVLEIFPDRF